jgi:hypothetical protein
MQVRVRRARQKGIQLVRGEEGVSKDDTRRMEEMVCAAASVMVTAAGAGAVRQAHGVH